MRVIKLCFKVPAYRSNEFDELRSYKARASFKANRKTNKQEISLMANLSYEQQACNHLWTAHYLSTYNKIGQTACLGLALCPLLKWD